MEGDVNMEDDEEAEVPILPDQEVNAEVEDDCQEEDFGGPEQDPVEVNSDEEDVSRNLFGGEDDDCQEEDFYGPEQEPVKQDQNHNSAISSD